MNRSNYDVIQAATQFYEKLRATVLILQILAKPEMWLQKQFKVHLSLLSAVLKTERKRGLKKIQVTLDFP